MNKMNRKRVLQRSTKVALIIVVLLIVIGVCFFAYNRDTMREHCSLESIIVDQFDSEGIIICTPNFQGYEIMYAYVTKDTKGYDEFIHRNDLVGYKIEIYRPCEMTAIFPVSFNIIDYKIEEKASEEELKEAMKYYEPVKESYEEFAKQK